MHNGVLRNIVKPSASALADIWVAYQLQKDEVDKLDVVGAAEWLRDACDEEPFHSQMAKQASFLKERLSGAV